MKKLMILVYSFVFMFYIPICSCNSQQANDTNQIMTKVSDSLQVREDFYSDGKIKEKAYFDQSGNLHGKYYLWFSNGVKSTEWNYHHGKRHGKQFSWWENGQKEEEKEYYLGKLHGESIIWSATGKVLSLEYYEHGTLTKKNEIKDDYVNPILFDALINKGIDSLTAVKILQENLSGKILHLKGKDSVILDEKAPEKGN